MFNRIRSALGSREAEGPEDQQRSRGAFRTDAGLLCLWRPAAFAAVVDDPTWDRELGDDADILRHIATGDFVPINIGADGAFEIEVRVGSADSPAALGERERSHLEVSSQPYRFTCDGELRLSGVEHVYGTPDDNVARLDLIPGEYAVVVHLVAWDREPGMLTAAGTPSPEALPDFVVTVNPATQPTTYRTLVETFDRSP